MTGYNLPNNYTDNPEALLMKSWSHTASFATLPAVEPVSPTPSATTAMVKSLHDYFNPAVASVPGGPAINMGTENFELRTGLITMV